jgi:hypothetical protein
MSKTIWNKVEKLTAIDPDATRSCVGMCTVSNRAHYSAHESFDIRHSAYNCNGEIMYKGHCAGHPLNTGVTTAVVVDDSLTIPAEWTAVERWTIEVAAAAKIRAEEQATRLRRFNDVRKKLRAKAPKSHMARFNRAVRKGLWLEAKSLANRYGVRI